MNSKAYELLSIAIRKNSFELAKKVLKKDPSVIIDEQWSDYTLLIKALQRGRKRIAIFLIKNGCRVNRTSKTNFYFTPLYYAVRLGDIELVSLLLDKDALINGKDKNQKSALCLAMKMKHFKIVELMLSKYCYQKTLLKGDNHDDLTAYFIAIMTHYKSYLKERFGSNSTSTYQINDELKLHYAVEDRCPELAHVLIDCGADIAEKNAEGSTALHVAFLSHLQENPKYMTDPLMDQIVQGHTEKTENCIDSNGISHFHIACTRDNPEIVKCFLRQQMNINTAVPTNSKFLSGFTPLHFAAHFKRKSVIKLLLENNADPTIVDSEGSTPLHVAFLASIVPRENSNNEIVDLLLTRVNDNKQDFVNIKGISYLHIASHRNNIEMVKNLITYGADVNQAISVTQNFFSGYTPLHFAVKNKNLDLIKLLLEYKANINAKNGKKLTPLHEAWFQKNHYTNSEIDDSIIDLLLSAHDKNSKNSLDKNGFSHLHIACARKNPDVVKNFLQKPNSGINKVSRESKYFGSCTPLYCAVKYNRASNVKLLLEHGADINGGEFTSAMIPLYQACMFNYYKVCDLLQKEVKDELLGSDHNLDHSRNISDWVSNRNDQIEIIKLLLEYKSDVNTKNHVYGPILFHLYDLVLSDGFIDFLNCCKRPRFRKFCDQILLREFLIRRAAIVKIFLEYNFNVNLRDHRGESFLHKLAKDYDNDTENSCLAELFLKNGANIDARNEMNTTPIHYAIHTGQKSVVEVFLKYNANLNRADYTGHTPLHLIC